MKTYVIFSLLLVLIASQTVNWVYDGYMRLSRYNVLTNKYCNRWCTFTDVNIPYSWGLVWTRQILSITALDFTRNGASLGLNLKLVNDSNYYYKFSIQILNETVLHNLKVDVLALYNGLSDYYTENGWLDCKQLSKGQGYRSQNYSIPIFQIRSYYHYYNQSILATVYLNSFLIYNPQGQYIYLDWKIHINRTHITIQFQTNQKNIVTHIGFSLIASDLTYVQSYYFFRLIDIGSPQCPGPQCPGTGGFDPGIFYQKDHQQFWGMSGMNFTKSQQINWYLNTSSFSNLAAGYVQSAGIPYLKVSKFVVALRQCRDFDNDPLTLEYFDPGTLTCTQDCSLTTYPYTYPYNINLCVSCHYQCQTCVDQFYYTCTACNPSHYRYPTPYYGNVYCRCNSGYVDLGAKVCQKCSDLIQGCVTCDLYNRCLTCAAGLQPSTDKTKCKCIDSTKFLTRSAECISIDGCLSTVNGTSGQKLCIQCDIQKNIYLKADKCECLPGYIVDQSQPFLTCIQSCGDKIITVNEQCDDGNTVSGDGCDSTCLIEKGFDCFSNYTDVSFCILNFTSMRHYETLKIVDEENTVEVYFTFQPFFQKYLDYFDIFKSLFNSSSLETENDKFTNITYEFYNHEDKEIRFKIRFKYLEKVNQSQQHYVRFFIRDQNRTHYLSQTLQYTLKSKNYPLYIDHEAKDLHDILLYVLLSGIIIGYLIFFISILGESWIGIQLMHTIQWLFLYFFLFDNLESSMSPYLKILKLSVGYNKISDEVSPYIHYQYHNQLLRFGYVKQFFYNFNYSALLFGLPILMILVKKFVNWRRKKQSLKQKAFARTKRNDKQSKNRSICSEWVKNNKILSFDFIFGRLMLSFNMVNMFQVFFSFFIQISPWFELDDSLNNIFFPLYTYFIILIELSFCAWIYIEGWERLTYDSQTIDKTHKRIFKFQGFNYSYPLFYIFFQLVKIIAFVLLFEEKVCLYVMMGCDGFSLIFYIVYRPYQKPKEETQPRGYFIHNMHNIWNSIGLTGFLVLVYFMNLKKEEEVQEFTTIIIYCVIGIYYGSILFALLRVFYTGGLFDRCLKKIYSKIFEESDPSENPLLCQVKFQKQTLESNESKKRTKQLPSILRKQIFRKQLKQMPSRPQIISKIKNRLMSNMNQKELISLQKSRSSRTTYKIK